MTMRERWPDKDPDETLTYSIVWSNLLGDDPITNVEWTIPPGLTAGTETQIGYVTVILLSGGTDGTTYDVQCTVTTTAGLVYSRSPQLTVAVR